MYNIAALVQLKAFARQDAIALAVLWSASFLAFMMNPSSSWGNLLAICTPFLVGWLLMRFRDTALDGFISFRRALAYCWYVFFYASLIFALVQYIYFQFFDHGKFMAFISDSLKLVEPFYKAQGVPMNEVRTAFKELSQMSAIQESFTFMMQNLFIGLVLGLPIALIGKRTNRGNDRQKNNQTWPDDQGNI
jgi:hypothetical protein